ncbi:hypothetical protein [Pseudomaricurvus sp. HS19]|uniref:hypothetical protein n=1 Tax=Pseudomaricurvus sp. HS19 TaxID=2692626 RepID=UPI001369E626|nr:hypothetical protein [Pseudomaricurvus sp. HS19]MYM63415.1 hypothetical protein [Pseudomaricurvus sp. HS19]
MIIEIIKPVSRCQTEEDIFYQRLTDIDGADHITTVGSRIQLTITASTASVVLEQVTAICDMWHTRWDIVSN